MTAIWTELSAVEDTHHCRSCGSRTSGSPGPRTPGPAARRSSSWRADLTAGDFVRAVKQLMELLGQMAVVGGELGPMARGAVDALRRGVVAYSSVE
jgi:ATP-dependent RNA helicase HelY